MRTQIVFLWSNLLHLQILQTELLANQTTEMYSALSQRMGSENGNEEETLRADSPKAPGCCSWVMETLSESTRPMAEKPGWARSLVSWCSRNPALHSHQTFSFFFFLDVTPPLSELTQKPAADCEYVTTRGVCHSFTNVQHPCSGVLQWYSFKVPRP